MLMISASLQLMPSPVRRHRRFIRLGGFLHLNYSMQVSLLLDTIWPVRVCGRFTIKLHEKLKRATNLRIPLKPLLAMPRVGNWLFMIDFHKLSEITSVN
jgi:hypothetical protein